MRLGIAIGVAALLLSATAMAGTIYSNNFTTMTDISSVIDTAGAGEVGVGPAPGAGVSRYRR